MEEHFILRVPPEVAERLERVLNLDPGAGNDASINLSFQEDGRSGTFVIGEDSFPAALLDLPAVVESYKTYDDNVLIKTADVGQMIMVGGKSVDPPPDSFECKHGITPPMRDARRRRFRKDPDLNPDYMHQVEDDLQSIMAGGTARDVDIELVEQEEDAEDVEEEGQGSQPPTASALTNGKAANQGVQGAERDKDAVDVDMDEDDDEDDYD